MNDKHPILRPALTVFVLLSALTGIVYPLAVTGEIGRAHV